MARGGTIYSVEGAVWACLTISWLVARLSLSKSPLEESVLIAGAALALGNLLCGSLANDREQGERLCFHMTFALWLFFVYAVAECLSTPALGDKLTLSPSLGSVLSVASVGLSLALLTIQTLVAGAAVSESLWAGAAWADAFLPLVASFQACASHTTASSMSLSALVLWTSFCVFTLFGIRFAFSLPLESKVGLITLDQFLEILSLSLKSCCTVFALVLAYANGKTTWALPAAFAVPLAIGTLKLIFKFLPRPPLKTSAANPQERAETAPSAPPQSQVEAANPVYRQEEPDYAPSAPPQSQVEAVKTDYFAYRQEAQHRMHHFLPKNLTAQSGQRYFHSVASKIAQDALLFKNTHPFVHKTKKCS